MKIKIGESEYTFKSLLAGDRWRLRDLQVGNDLLMNQLMSKSILKDDKVIEIHEVALLDGRVGEKFSRWLTIPILEPLDGGSIDIEEISKGATICDRFKLENHTFSYNPDYTTEQYTRFLSLNQTQPGTATANLIRARLLMEDRVIRPDELNGLPYTTAIALEQYLALAFTEPLEPQTS